MIKIFTLMVCMLATHISGCQSHSVQENQDRVTVNPAFSSPHNNRPIANEKHNGFQIKGKNQTGTFSSVLENGWWKIGGISIENWPLNTPFCHECEISLDRRHHPDGATVWLKLINETSRKLYVISSYQQQFYALGWSFKHENNKVKVIHAGSKRVTLINAEIRHGQKLNANSDCTMLWSNKYFLKQPGPGISNDVAQFRSQFIIECAAK